MQEAAEARLLNGCTRGCVRYAKACTAVLGISRTADTGAQTPLCQRFVSSYSLSHLSIRAIATVRLTHNACSAQSASWSNSSALSIVDARGGRETCGGRFPFGPLLALLARNTTGA